MGKIQKLRECFREADAEDHPMADDLERSFYTLHFISATIPESTGEEEDGSSSESDDNDFPERDDQGLLDITSYPGSPIFSAVSPHVHRYAPHRRIPSRTNSDGASMHDGPSGSHATGDDDEDTVYHSTAGDSPVVDSSRTGR